MKFPYLLFDADDTLFDFPKAAARAFSAMCRSNGVPDTLDTRALYHRINQELWAAFDRGEVSKDYVTLERFVRFFQALKLPRDPDKCNRDYLTALGAGVYPLPHAEAVCRELVRRGHKLYIVTNAVASVQRSRLQGSVFADLITDAFISEDAGASKPDPAYYAYVRSRIPGLTPENGLVIGDSLSTDIQGANNAGLPCCWYNPAGKARPEDLRIDYEIRDLRELLEKRRASQPLEFPSAGSTFKRPEGYYAGTLIDQCGLKGLTVGGAQVSEKHAGFVINRGGATCADVKELIRQIQERVFAQAGVRLEPEVRIID